MSMMRTKMPDPQLKLYHLSDRLTAFSTTRHGGYGCGNYSEFNVNLFCGDNPETIAKNRQLLCRKLCISESGLVMPHQVHGTEILNVDEDFLALEQSERKEKLENVDALMTNVKSICIGVSTADCIPIIIYDSEHEAACVVHAGWRGTVQRIVRKAVLAMISVYGSDPGQMEAVIGPGISLESFEVGDEVYRQFSEASFPMQYISRKMPAMHGGPNEKWHIDLWECNRLQLQSLGLMPSRIHVVGICTYQCYDDFFSARRLGVASGRILTGIVLH